MAKHQNQQQRSNQMRDPQGSAPRSQKMGGFSQLSQQWDRSRSQ